MSSPLVIGGTGGSGTRVVARIVRLGGRYMGAERNGSEDAMPLARFDRAWGLQYLQFGADAAISQALDDAIAEHLARLPEQAAWGWKHPRSYLLLPLLHERFPELRFIHVIRDGRDIALSRNQQQAQHYGHLLGRPDEPLQVRSAAWWAWANLRAEEQGKRLGDNYLLLRFEDLCADPFGLTRRIVQFAGADEPLSTVSLAAEIVPPDSIGRWRMHAPNVIARIEAACGDGLRRFGYLNGEAAKKPRCAVT